MQEKLENRIAQLSLKQARVKQGSRELKKRSKSIKSQLNLDSFLL